MARARAQDEFTRPTGTVLGRGFTINAAQVIGAEAESMRLDGVIHGNIEMDGVLNLGETGRVEGDILAESARIAGAVHGSIQCRFALHLTDTAEVTGDILTETLIIDKGAVLHGRCQTSAAPGGAVSSLTYATASA
ncbi:MAG: polymer-forming cytoskeletal protein [Defluviitaleaceae bacterium]|nr:polymer-forming cytoskeletal protein [Defluviitaleaceae bacterium]MCL2275033.1 polymer-forming cytoskeletal protein [Defluviitaleaceae bacterium]